MGFPNLNKNKCHHLRFINNKSYHFARKNVKLFCYILKQHHIFVKITSYLWSSFTKFFNSAVSVDLGLRRRDVSSFYTKNKIFIPGLGVGRAARGGTAIIYLTNGFKPDICPFKSFVNNHRSLFLEQKCIFPPQCL